MWPQNTTQRKPGKQREPEGWETRPSQPAAPDFRKGSQDPPAGPQSNPKSAGYSHSSIFMCPFAPMHYEP